MSKVQAICTSEAKGVRKTAVESAVFRADHGIETDAHAGQWHRQVSLLVAEDIDTLRHKGMPDLAAGDFAENVVVSGVSLDKCGLGTRLKLGSSVTLAISQIGKVCHTRCQIFHQTGDCIMPRLGLFARVETGGTVAVGDSVELLERVPRERFQIVVLTISDRCSQGQAQDTAGPAVAESLSQSLDAHIYRTEILPDERDRVADRLKHYCDGHSIDCVVTVGGTGFSPRDVTPEASRDVIERFTPGLDEAMRAASLAKTPHAMLSRATSGIRGSTLIVNLPGSQRAAVENIEAVLEALGHGLAKLRGDPTDCGRPTGEPTP